MYGYRDLSDADAAAGLREFLDGRAWTHAEGPYRLFGLAVTWLRRNRVLLPGVSVLARLVAGVRDGAADRMYRSLSAASAAADPALPSRLQSLLAVPGGQRVSELERLRAAPDAARRAPDAPSRPDPHLVQGIPLPLAPGGKVGRLP